MINMTRRFTPEHLTWLVPFACIGLITAALSRPTPQFPAQPKDHIVIDAEGAKVPIAIPFRGIMLTWGAWSVGGYLENTRAPESVFNAGDSASRESFSREVMNWIYPDIFKNDQIWDADLISQKRGSNAEIETLLARDAGAYLGNGGNFGAVPLLRRIGLPALTLCSPSPNSGTLSSKTKTWEDVCYSAARVETSLIGHPETAESLIARYRQAFTDLERNLRIAKIDDHPRVLIMGSSSNDWRLMYVKNSTNGYQLFLPPAGVENAADENQPQGSDAERILVMDPDFIFEMGYGQSPEEFKKDPRWHGLKAVHDNHVYTMPGPDRGGGGLVGLIFQPLWARWMAEIVHPYRLRAELRGLLRDRLDTEFNYRLSDEQIDLVLQNNKNKDSDGYSRFNQNYLASNRPEPLP